MNNTPTRSNGFAGTTPGEEMLLINVAMAAVVTVMASAGALWLAGTEWLVEHHILVPRAADPIIEVPGAAGAGLDLPRVAVAAGILLALLAIALSSARRALTRREEAA